MDWCTNGKEIATLLCQTNATVSFQEKPFPADTICFTTVSILTIANVHVKDEGYYCCIASNECGKSKECAWLEIDSKLYHLIGSRG